MSTLHPPFFTKIFKFFQANLSVILFTKMKDKERPFQAAFEKQNFDNFIARMGTFPAHGAAVQVRFARKAAVELIALTGCNTTGRHSVVFHSGSQPAGNPDFFGRIMG